MPRHLIVPRLQDRFGNALRNADVEVFETGTTTPIDVFAAETGGSPLVFPVTTGIDGSVELWTEFDDDIDVVYTDSGNTVDARGRRAAFSPPITETRNHVGDRDYNDARYIQSTNIRHGVALTQAAYDALAPPDPDTVYFING